MPPPVTVPLQEESRSLNAATPGPVNPLALAAAPYETPVASLPLALGGTASFAAASSPAAQKAEGGGKSLHSAHCSISDSRC